MMLISNTCNLCLFNCQWHAYLCNWGPYVRLAYMPNMSSSCNKVIIIFIVILLILAMCTCLKTFITPRTWMKIMSAFLHNNWKLKNCAYHAFVFVLIVHLFVSYAHVNLCHFFSSSWCRGLAAASAFGSSWTFLFTFLYSTTLQYRYVCWGHTSLFIQTRLISEIIRE